MIEPYGGKTYFTDGRYNKMDYEVNQGFINGTNGDQFVGYEVWPASIQPSKFVAVRNYLQIKFPTKEDYTIYKYDGDFTPIDQIRAEDISLGQYTKLARLDITLVWPESQVLVFLPSN